MNPIVTILNLRSSEKQVGCIQHQSAAANKSLIVAFVAHQNYLGVFPRTKDIIAAMNKSQPMVAKYIKQLESEGFLGSLPSNTDGRALEWFICLQQ